MTDDYSIHSQSSTASIDAPASDILYFGTSSSNRFQVRDNLAQLADPLVEAAGLAEERRNLPKPVRDDVKDEQVEPRHEHTHTRTHTARTHAHMHARTDA